MKKVATITFQDANNYGAMLQCYALQHTIKNIGYQCDVIDYYCEYLAKPYCKAAIKRKGIIRYILGNINVFVRWPRKKRFKEFRKKIERTSKVDCSTIDSLNSEYDIFITGSDQVWNYKLTNFDTRYFLDFVCDSRKKMSYAASLGFDSFPSEIADNYYSLLKDFAVVNVREQSACELLKTLLGDRVFVGMDPTLLLMKNDWDEVSVETKYSGYIFVYQLSPSKYMTNILKELKKATGLKVIAVPFVMGAVGAKCALGAGPSEWIGYIKNAEYVVTDSFHATAFSLIYSKKLYSCVNESASRITDLLGTVGMECFLYTKDRQFELINNVDYEAAQKIIAEERKKSISMLSQMIEGEKVDLYD